MERVSDARVCGLPKNKNSRSSSLFDIVTLRREKVDSTIGITSYYSEKKDIQTEESAVS